jgi:putative PIN family toxin of toxin-antitoxin system
MKVVLDTHVLVSAFLSPSGVPARILKYFEQEAFELLLSEEILMEYKAALRYDQVKKAHKLADVQIAGVLEDLRAPSKLIRPTVSVSVVASDPDDNMLFACALAGGAQFVISGDTHVLAVKHYQEIQVLSPKLFLIVLEQKA